MQKALLRAVVAFTILGASIAVGQTIPNNVTFRDFFTGLTKFNRPVFFVPMPGRDSAYFVVEQSGTVQFVSRQGNAWVKSLFVTIPVTGGTSAGNEQGLLGLAFHPQYTVNRKFYLYYVGNPNASNIIVERIAKSNLTQDSGVASRTILEIPDLAQNHNGGTIRFGQDGFLYVGTGDGGGGGDVDGNAQNKLKLFGKMLRIDVDRPANGKQYGIPTDNPFVGNSTYAPEIWAFGLRNPYRWSFHPTRNEVWVGDVGQNEHEEIDLVPKGANMGWNIWEAAFCYGGTTCSPTGMTAPVLSFNRSEVTCITGGVFFRGETNSAFHDTYIFGDYANPSNIWAMRLQGTTVLARQRIGSLTNVSSFNNDHYGRVFAMGLNEGLIKVLESPDMKVVPIHLNKKTGRLGYQWNIEKDAPDFHSLQGKRMNGIPGNGVYVIRDAQKIPTLVPVLK